MCTQQTVIAVSADSRQLMLYVHTADSECLSAHSIQLVIYVHTADT
jgi:hypothetical protein